MKISVIIPFRNESKYIEACINAVIEQDFPQDQYEIIMVNNNSTDRSVEIVENYPSIKLYHQPIQGNAITRNLGLAHATGSLIAFVDSDTVPAKDWLRNNEKAMRDSSVNLIVGRLEFKSAGLPLKLVEMYELEKTRFVFSRKTKSTLFCYTCNLAIRKSVFENLGFFAEVRRSADILFLRNVVETYGIESVRFEEEVRVSRFEIATIWQYFKKLSNYGRDAGIYSKAADLRPINISERLEVLKNIMKRKQFSVLNICFLFMLLIIGMLCYDFSRLVSSSRLLYRKS